ncbi:MAG: TonB family protein [Gammaproteobacteria bacterium]|nr:TonB family protein [Gammaproteobacteria bacterium]MDH5736046.1 TonB family protein [Gammaproteobacteria bacterium]
MFKYHIEPWKIFLLMSVLAHAAVLVTWGGRLGVQDASLDNIAVRDVINIQLVQQQPVKKPKAEVLPEPAPMPVREEKIVEQLKAVEKPVEENITEPEQTQHEVAQIIEPQRQGDQIQNDHQLKIKQKEQYIQLIMKHIDAHKFYPSAARRRGIEGEVRVSFCLTTDKIPMNIQANGSISVLERAAMQAVQDASPYPEPPADTFFNSPIVISMVYALE